MSSGRPQGVPSRITNDTGVYLRCLNGSADARRLTFLRGKRVRHSYFATFLKARSALGPPQSLVAGDNWDKWEHGWTPDSRSILYRSNPQGKRGIYTQDSQTHKTQTLIVGPDFYDDPVFTSNGQWLLFTQSPAIGRNGRSTLLLRMPANGGPPTFVLKGNFTFQCASHANRCVLLELRDGQSFFYALDPLPGRGSLLAKTDPVSSEYLWDLSGDGKFVAFLQDVKNSDNSTIKVVSLENNATTSIERLNESVVEVVWDTDNQHLFLNTSAASFFLSFGANR